MAAQPEVAEVNEIEARLARVSKQLDSNRKSKQADEEAVANMEGKKLEMQNQLDDVKVACEELERDLREAQEERKWLFDRYSRIVLNGGVVFPKDKAGAGFTGVDSEPLGGARRNQDLPDTRTRREQRSASPAHILKKYSRVHSEKVLQQEVLVLPVGVLFRSEYKYSNRGRGRRVY
jgi:hypothetical protein